MVNIGWIQDFHQPSEEGGYNGPQGTITTLVDELATTREADDIFIAGDLCHPFDRDLGNVPHVKPEAYDKFWGYVDAANNNGLVNAAIPGNHDIPLQSFLQSDDRATLRKRVDYPGDGVSVFLLNTVPGFTTGGISSSAAGSGQGAIGPNRGLVAYSDLVWLDEQLDDAGTNAKIVIPHHFLYMSDSSVPDTHSPTSPPTMMGGDPGVGGQGKQMSYIVVLNFAQVHEILQKYSKVVVPQSHKFLNGKEGSYVTDGVTYVWKSHYYSPGNDQVIGTYGSITVDSSSVRIDTIGSAHNISNTPVNKSF